VAGTLQAVMQLVGNGQLVLTKPISNYLPELVGTNKADIMLQDLLEHKAGLQPFIPFWKRTMINNQLSFKWYCDRPEDGFTQAVTPHLYTQPSTTDSVWGWIVKSDLLPRNVLGQFDVKYSDFSFLLLQRVVERVTKEPLNAYLNTQFYSKLGTRLTYNPLNTTAPGLIAPTELDSTWRKGLVVGTVHDQTAALLGGVAGHAGLFGNANDLAILMQMNLQDGYYGGHRYLQPGMVAAFGRRVEGTARGFGWDKPSLDKREKLPISQFASPETYGHTGFTGNCVWVDPVYDLVFIFLSNRVYPDANNVKLSKSQMRGRMHDVVYESIRVNFPNLPEPAIIAP
jgi:CubicO group peptidase (beta-lactamase class C family)